MQRFRDAAVQSGRAVDKTLEDNLKKAISSQKTLLQEARTEIQRAQVAQARAVATAVAAAPTQAQAGVPGATQAATQGIQKQTRDARELSYQLQQINFQITDIVTGLATGQSPLTVLLQQGGQLKDMFGGVGGAIRALGQGLAALISPLSVIAVALGGVGLAAFQGRKETLALALALNSTDGAAGVTKDGLDQIARSAAQTVGTVGSASKALTILANSAVVTGDSMEQIVIAAQKLEKVGGPAVEETLQLFIQLGQTPVDSALRLNKSLNFLTESIFKQIKALEAQGDRQGAARVAQDALARAVNQRTKEQEQNLGLLEKAYRGVTDGAKKFWDQLKEIGRDTTTVDRIKQLEAAITQINTRLAENPQAGGAIVERYRTEVARLQAELARLRSELESEEEEAGRRALAQQAEQRRIARAALGTQTGASQATLEASTAAIKASIEDQRAELDIGYERNLVSLQNYFDRRQDLVRQEAAAEAQVLEQQASDLRDRLARGVPVEQEDATLAQLVGIESRLTTLRAKSALDLKRLAEDRRKAERDADQSLQNALATAQNIQNLSAAQNAAQIDAIEDANRRGITSLETYFRLRKEFLDQDFADERQVAEARLALARRVQQQAGPENRAQATRDVREAEFQLAALQARNAQRQAALERDRRDASEADKKLTAERILQLQELTGEETSALAVEQRRLLLLEQYRVELERVRQTDIQRALTLERIISIQEGEQRLAAERTKFSREANKFDEERAQIDFARAQGLITESEYQRQVYDLTRKRARVELDLYSRLRDELGGNLTEESRQQLDQYIANAKRGLASLTPAAVQLNNALQQGFATAIQGLLDGTSKVKDAFKSLAQSVAAAFTQIISQNIAASILRGLGGSAFGAGIGKIFGFADGGMVRGPGSGTSDSIPARLSNGEFVQPARTVSFYGAEFMEALRRLQVPRLGLATGGRGYASGGLVGSSNSAAAPARSQDIPVQVNIQNSGTGKTAQSEARFDGKGLVVSVLLDDIRSNGPIYQGITNANRLRR
jgi:hypothetical protein